MLCCNFEKLTVDYVLVYFSLDILLNPYVIYNNLLYIMTKKLEILFDDHDFL